MKQLFFLASCVFLSLPLFAHAATETVMVSEVAWAGSSLSNADEWIELVNLSGSDVSLASWSLAGAGTSGSALVFPEDAVISASSTFIIANYDASHENSSLLNEPDWVTSSVSLSNSALQLSLFDAEGVLMDSVGDGGAPLAGYSGEVRASMHRLLEANGEGVIWETSETSEGFKEGIVDFGSPGIFSTTLPDETPVEEPETEVPVEEPEIEEPETEVPVEVPETEEPRPARPDPIVTAIKISEVYPAPLTGEDEWIELFNMSSIGEFLDGWIIEDEKGGATSLEGLMLPWSYLVIEKPKGALNNSGDIVLLKDQKGRVIDGMSYGTSLLSAFPHVTKPAKGESLIRPEFKEYFVVTGTPTPGETNIENIEPEPEVPAPTSPLMPPKNPVPEKLPEVVAPPPLPEKADPPPFVKVATFVQTPKPAPVIQKTISKSRYKGKSYTATIAVPPGIYGKTRMRVIVDDKLHDLHLTKSSSHAFVSGERIGFVAQEKEDAGSIFLLANINSLYKIDPGTSFEFTEATSWPETVGAYRIQGEVRSINGRTMQIGVEDTEGIVYAPKSLNGRGVEEGDRIEVLGFFSPGIIPELVMLNEEALKSLEPLSLMTDEPSEMPRWVGIVLLFVVVAGGVAFHLYQEKRRLRLIDTPLH